MAWVRSRGTPYLAIYISVSSLLLFMISQTQKNEREKLYLISPHTTYFVVRCIRLSSHHIVVVCLQNKILGALQGAVGSARSGPRSVSSHIQICVTALSRYIDRDDTTTRLAQYWFGSFQKHDELMTWTIPSHAQLGNGLARSRLPRHADCRCVC